MLSAEFSPPVLSVTVGRIDDGTIYSLKHLVLTYVFKKSVAREMSQLKFVCQDNSHFCTLPADFFFPRCAVSVAQP